MARLPYDPLRLGKLIAEVWGSPTKRTELLTHPKATLEAAGVEVGDHRVIVHEDSPSTIHIVIPYRQETAALAELPEDYLRTVGHGLLDGCDRPKQQ